MSIMWSVAGTIIISVLSYSVSAQGYESQRLNFTAYNIGFNGLIGGIGAAINKKNDQTRAGAFINGFGKGAIGGLVIHTAKSYSFQIYNKEQLTLVWPVRIINAVGTSMVLNATANKGLLDEFHMSIWMMRLNYHRINKNFNIRISPTAIVGMYKMSRHGSFDFKNSLRTGLMYYNYDPEKIKGYEVRGRAFATSIAVGVSEYDHHRYYEVVAHELMHNLQHESAVSLQPILSPIDKKLKRDVGIYKKLSCYIYIDLNFLALSPLRAINTGGSCDLSSLIEKEAHHYATRSFITCNEDVYEGRFLLLH